MERSKVVINIAKITQINRTLNYLLECNKGEEIDYPTHLHPELNHIDDWAFEDCANLVSINIPKNVIRIGTWAFAHCDKLSGIVLPEGLQ